MGDVIAGFIIDLVNGDFDNGKENGEDPERVYRIHGKERLK